MRYIEKLLNLAFWLLSRFNSLFFLAEISPKQLEDPHIHIVLLRQGNTDAFGAIYDFYSGAIFSKLLRMVKDKMIAEELLQEVFLKVWENMEKIDPAQSLKSWIYAIAINLVYDYYRKVSRDTKMQQVMLDQFADLYYANTDDALFEERRKLLDQALALLPPQRLAVFKLCRIEGKSYQQAADELGISPSTVSNQLVQATKTLKEYVFNSKPLLLLLISWFFHSS